MPTAKPAGLPPVAKPTAPEVQPPVNACDAHIHMLGGPSDFPLSENRVEDPASDFNFDRYINTFQTHLQTLGLTRAVIVQSILYGDDNSVTLAALRRLGPNFRGIALLKDTAPEAAVDGLANNNVKGLRLNYVHGGVLSWQGVQRFAPMLAARDMHVQMLVNADKHLADLEPDLRRLPCPVVFDHIAWPNLTKGLTDPGFQTLLRLVGDGVAYVKLSGLYRLAAAPWQATAPFVEALAKANPQRCLWASDWPHIMLADAQLPDAGALLNAFFDVITDDYARRTILTDAPEKLYGF